MSDELRKAAEALEYGYDDWPECLPRALMDARKVARDYLELTDPTPLTVDKLVEMKFVIGGRHGLLHLRGSLGVGRTHLDVKDWVWFIDEDEMMRSYICLNPRTVGELNQLLARVGDEVLNASKVYYLSRNWA